jgi:hypothetical protein
MLDIVIRQPASLIARNSTLVATLLHSFLAFGRGPPTKSIPIGSNFFLVRCVKAVYWTLVQYGSTFDSLRTNSVGHSSRWKKDGFPPFETLRP